MPESQSAAPLTPQLVQQSESDKDKPLFLCQAVLLPHSLSDATRVTQGFWKNVCDHVKMVVLVQKRDLFYIYIIKCRQGFLPLIMR